MTLRHMNSSTWAGVGQWRWETVQWPGIPAPAQGFLRWGHTPQARHFSPGNLEASWSVIEEGVVDSRGNN